MISIKNQKGVTLVSIIISIIILGILAAITYTAMDSSDNIAPYNKMLADLNLLEDKILVYYNKYQEIPKKSNQVTIDEDIYYEIDLSKLDGLTLNFGRHEDEEDIYLVNNHLKVYYLKGIEKNGVLEHKIKTIQTNSGT